MSCLSSFYINLPDIWLANFFSYSTFSCSWLFPLLYRIFLIWCSAIYFCFSCLCFCCQIKNNNNNNKTKIPRTLPRQMTKRSPLCFLLTVLRFLISFLSLKSILHFFEYDVRYDSSLILFMQIFSFLNTICWRRILSFSLCILSAFVKDYLTICAWLYF